MSPTPNLTLRGPPAPTPYPISPVPTPNPTLTVTPIPTPNPTQAIASPVPTSKPSASKKTGPSEPTRYTIPCGAAQNLTYAASVGTLETATTLSFAVHVSLDEVVLEMVLLVTSDTFHTIRVMDRSGHANVSVPYTNSSMTVKVICPVGCTDVSGAANWTLEQHPAVKQPFVEYQQVLQTYNPQQRHQSPSCLPEGRCGFVNGEEEVQAWYNTNSKDQEHWRPEKCSLDDGHGVVDKFSTSSLSILLIGDSPMRTTYQAMIASVCSKWSFFCYPGPGVKRRSWCPSKPIAPAPINPSVRIGESVCGADFKVWGDGCWSGGASYVSPNNLTIAYADSHHNQDFRFEEYSFVRNNTFDIVVVANDLHNANFPVNGQSLASYLRRMRKWHQGPILSVGVWASSEKKRAKDYWWAASLFKESLMRKAGREAVLSMTQLEGFWRLDLLRMTLDFRDQTSDGVHLFWPMPMRQIAQVIWHDIGQILARV